jgi:hypothetical protein
MVRLILVKQDKKGEILSVGVKEMSLSELLNTNMLFPVVNPLPPEILRALSDLFRIADEQEQEHYL